jgi:thiosulfate/3-mercaptopyruvate sulfurtransferase
LEPWEKVLVNAGFMESVHGQASCIDCHGGVQSADKEEAHAGMVADPSADVQQCAACHAKQAENFDTSLHASLNGYWTVLDARSTPENHPQLEEGFNNHCASCHTTCGDCHISQPNSVGGGLLNGHIFEKTPPMTRTCTACHGSRVGAEYLGQHEDIPGDVHFRQGRMNCVTCHKGEDLHASPGEMGEHRYAGAQLPACEDCHAEIGASGDPIQQHTIHGDTLSCQVCHSVQYTSCDGCHVAISEETGNPFYKTERDYLTFFIGRNPIQNEHRPYEYVTVRHVPISPTSFEYYGENLLPNFDALPTWAYATPHNIQRKTPQNETCQACHGNADIFLTADKVKPEELEANQPVIVQEVPAAIGQ